MTNSMKKLLVEGFTDAAFFNSLICHMLNLKKQTEIKVDNQSKDEWKIDAIINPEPRRGKNNIISHIIKNEIKNILQQKTTHLGIVVDADYTNSDKGLQGKGYDDTKQLIEAITLAEGYSPFARVQNSSGWICEHNNKNYGKVGLWIMPNNKDDGMFEDFVIANIKNDNLALNDYAKEIVTGLYDKKLTHKDNLFKEYHLSKAQVGTWNAWQKIPNDSIKIEHLNEDGEQVKQLVNWLQEVYEC